MDDPHSREKELRNYIGMVCCIASMTIIGVFWGATSLCGHLRP